RTLKHTGICVLTYADKEFMKTLPFIGSKFSLFGKTEIEDLVGNTELKIIEFRDKTEQVKSKTGESVQRKYTMVKLIRP
ncbi:MAG: class I SAM-dependent methyltransferase, partial [Bacteroidota bacterium]